MEHPMPNYHFGQDLLDTYQSMSVFMQLAWLVVPFLFSAVIFALILHHTRKVHGEIEAFPSEESTVYRLMNEDLRERIVARQSAGKD